VREVLVRLAAVLLVTASAGAQAAVFVCTAPDGRKITSDRVPTECGNNPIRELRPDGSVRRVIEPPLTAEQRAERAAQQRREQQEHDRRLSQVRRDRALLETYADEKEIIAARDEMLAAREKVIEKSHERLAQLKKDRRKLEDETEFYVNRKRPDTLTRALTANDEMVDGQQRLINDTRADMDRITTRFDAELKRYRELLAVGARPQVRTAATQSTSK
jgi:chromosome segregation ATPase